MTKKNELLILSSAFSIAGIICLVGKTGLTGWAHAGLLISAGVFFFSSVMIPGLIYESTKWR